MKDRVLTFALAGLAAIATAGWMRQGQSVMPTPAPETLVSSFQAPVPADSVFEPEAPATAPAVTPVRRAFYSDTAAAPAKPVLVARNNERRYRDEEPRLRQRNDRPYDDTYSRQERREIEQRRAEVEQREYPELRRERSTGKSATIVAGSAAAGAAVGAMAGGGKGAAIGAIAGGAGGYVYDRMTHKKNDGYGYRDVNGNSPYNDDRDNDKLGTLGRVGGGAAAGAAVGGMAGGGKGAAIGAITGAAGGYVWDRMKRRD